MALSLAARDGGEGDASPPLVPSDDAGSPSDGGTSDAGATEAGSIAKIRVETGHCMGGCPQFDITVKSDGTVVGSSKTKKLGEAETAELFGLADRAFSVHCQEHQRVMDLPRTTITFSRRGKALRSADLSCTPAHLALFQRFLALR